MRLTGWALAAALTGSFPALASAQGLAIDHAPVRCLVARSPAGLSARIDPAERVARARVYFRAQGGRHWYYLDMKPTGNVFQATLPRPRKDTARVEYYVEAVDTASASSRTPDAAPVVAGSRAECSEATALSGVPGARTSIPVNAPPGAPLVPAGFEATGVVAGAAGAGAAVATTAVATTAAVAGAGGGGIGTAALVVGGVVVAGGAAAAVTLGGGDDGSDGEDGRADGEQQCGTVTITGRTATTLTVTWSGGQPTDGKYIVDGGPVPAGTGCTMSPHDFGRTIVQGLSYVITGLTPATTYAIHVHPAGRPCATCDSGYEITDSVGAATAATLGQ